MREIWTGKPLRAVIATLRLLALVALMVGGAASYRSTWSSQVSALAAGHGVAVIDGDTLQIDGQLVQLYGIDAPELGQLCDRKGDLWPCGVEAALALKKLISFDEPPLHCSPWSKTSGRSPADGTDTEVCEIGDMNLSLTMLRNGYSVALPGSFPDYVEAQKQAQDAGLGLWQGDFVLPWKWREGTGAHANASDWVRKCNVKGALTPDGRHIYYVPTDAGYRDVAIDPARGERMFCSDDEARMAGWTRLGQQSDPA